MKLAALATALMIVAACSATDGILKKGATEICKVHNSPEIKALCEAPPAPAAPAQGPRQR